MVRSRRTVNDFFRLRKYAVVLCVMYQLMIISQACNLVFMVFAGSTVDVSGCRSKNFDRRIFSSLRTRSERCRKYESLKKLGNCTAVLAEDFKSINVEFGLLCSAENYVKWSTSIQMAGLLLGAVITWHFSEAFGPWKALALATLCLAIVSMASSFTGNLNSFTAARFFVMFFVGGQNSVSGEFFMENLPKRHRLWLVTMISFTPSYLIMSIIAYATGDWRWLARSISAFTIASLFLLCFIYESPVWLLRKGKIEKARMAILGIGEWDRSNKPRKMGDLDELLDDELDKQVLEGARLQTHYGLHSLFSQTNTAIYTVFFSLSLMVTSIINYGILFNLEYLHGSVHVNFFVIAILRVFAKLIFSAVDFFSKSLVGRRFVHLLSMAMIVVGLTTACMLVAHAAEESQTIRSAALISCALCSELYLVNAFSTAELFPATLRHVGNNVVQSLSKVGAFIGPHVFLLSFAWVPLPYLVMATLGTTEILGAVLFLPETKGLFYEINSRRERRGAARGSGANREQRQRRSLTAERFPPDSSDTGGVVRPTGNGDEILRRIAEEQQRQLQLEQHQQQLITARPESPLENDRRSSSTQSSGTVSSSGRSRGGKSRRNRRSGDKFDANKASRKKTKKSRKKPKDFKRPPDERKYLEDREDQYIPTVEDAPDEIFNEEQQQEKAAD